MDLGLVEQLDGGAPARAFVGIASAGFDSDANRIANEAPPWLGGSRLRVRRAARAALLAPGALRARARPPAERHSFTGYTVAVANSRAYGGGMYAAPDAMLDDGLLDVVAIEDVSRCAS